VSETLYDAAKRHQREAVALRRWFHSHPEASFAEVQTTQRIRQELEALGIEHVAAGETGTVGILRGQSGKPVLGLRADIDALEIEERNEVDYRSQNPGLMHACGHDAHTAALITAARLLSERREQLGGTVKLIFQPAEEVGRGAASVISTGALDDVDAFFGIHVRAGLPVGKVALKAGPAMAGANSLKIVVSGKSGHAGHPDEAIDAIAAGCAIVEALQHIVSREVSPTEPAVVSICQFHAGTRDNIVANRAEISGTVRVTSEKVRAQVAEAVRRVVAGISAAHRVTSQVECDFATPILLNAEELYPTAVQAAEDILSRGAVESFVRKLGTEDFSAYGSIAPAFFAFVGSGGQYPHHHERFDIEEEALAISAALHTAFAFRYFENNLKK
jgi:amidohydrolase